MSRLAAVAALVLVAAAPALSDPQVDAAIRALKGDSSLKVRTQAAIVLGQRGAQEAVRALRDAVAADRAAAVRIAAVTALAKIGDRSARSTLKLAAQADPDESVRRAATALRRHGVSVEYALREQPLMKQVKAAKSAGAEWVLTLHAPATAPERHTWNPAPPAEWNRVIADIGL